MKNDVSKGSGNRPPENISMAEQDAVSPKPRRNYILEGIARIIQAMKPKKFVSYRKKKVFKDGSSVETEFIYRDDR